MSIVHVNSPFVNQFSKKKYRYSPKNLVSLLSIIPKKVFQNYYNWHEPVYVLILCTIRIDKHMNLKGFDVKIDIH